MSEQVLVLLDDNEFKHWVVREILEANKQILEIKALLIEQGAVQAKIDDFTAQLLETNQRLAAVKKES